MTQNKKHNATAWFKSAAHTHTHRAPLMFALAFALFDCSRHQQQIFKANIFKEVSDSPDVFHHEEAVLFLCTDLEAGL